MIAQKVETPSSSSSRSRWAWTCSGLHFPARSCWCPAGKKRQDRRLRLLSLSMEDRRQHTIEAEFKRHPHLSVNLMRLVNSAACQRGQSITSLRHALVLLGTPAQLRVGLPAAAYTAERGNQSLGKHAAAARASRQADGAARLTRPGPDRSKELASSPAFCR